MPLAVRFSKSGELFAIGGTGTGEVLIYSTERMSRAYTLGDVGETVFSIDFANTAERIAVSCGHGTLKLYNLL